MIVSLTLGIILGCGKYYSLKDLNPENSNTAHYFFEDSDILMAANIRSGGVLGHFWYDFLLINKSNRPLDLNYVYDVASIQIGEKIYRLSKMTDVLNYPSVLNPDKHFNIAIKVPSDLNDQINNVQKIFFQLNFNEIEYILEKKPNAVWESDNN